jgi:hypothetical protein
VLGKPRVLHAELIGEPDKVGYFFENDRRGLIAGAFEMISESDLKDTQLG